MPDKCKREQNSRKTSKEEGEESREVNKKAHSTGERNENERGEVPSYQEYGTCAKEEGEGKAEEDKENAIGETPFLVNILSLIVKHALPTRQVSGATASRVCGVGGEDTVPEKKR